jgi:hypothetical protein
LLVVRFFIAGRLVRCRWLTDSMQAGRLAGRLDAN